MINIQIAFILLIFLLFILLQFVNNKSNKNHFRQLQASRIGQTYKNFRDDFEVLYIDENILLIVHQILTAYLHTYAEGLQIRANDLLINDLLIDEEDLNEDLIPKMLKAIVHDRFTCSSEIKQLNTYFAQVHTVRVLVVCIQLELDHAKYQANMSFSI